jgi:hypothetical protein
MMKKCIKKEFVSGAHNTAERGVKQSLSLVIARSVSDVAIS